jgi:hypothetical protein
MGQGLVEKHGERAAAEAGKVVAQASEAAQEAATRSQQQLVSAAGTMQSRVMGRAVRLRRQVVGGVLVVIFVYAAGRATPGALLRLGNSRGDGSATKASSSVTTSSAAAGVGHGLHIPDAAKGQQALAGEKSPDHTVGTGAYEQIGLGLGVGAAVLACVQFAGSRK